MSTYLIGIGISEFDYLESSVKIHVWPEDISVDSEVNVDELPTKDVLLRIYTPVGRSKEVRKIHFFYGNLNF